MDDWLEGESHPRYHSDLTDVRTCDAPRNPENGLIRCDLPVGHGDQHENKLTGDRWD